MYTRITRILILLLVMPICLSAQYTGTASVTQGLATTTIPSLYTCTGGRIPAIGTITASDLSTWTVPAEVHYTNSSFPFASDLYNPCNGNTYANTSAALAALTGSDIVTVDADGELITAYIFADNYVEMYVNGVPVGKDNVPYTQFNSNIIRFKAKRPFTIAMQLVDWEEHLGLGAEQSGSFAYHDGDGGMVAVFKDAGNHIIATTGPDWKAQVFYSSPITDLTCPTESGSLRLTTNCSTADATNGTSFYGLHWSKPAGCMDATFNDASWPNAYTYSNATVGVSNKPAYTNFTDLFDDPVQDAQFIWSSNLILDNEVIVRHTVSAANGIEAQSFNPKTLNFYPNPATTEFRISLPSGQKLSPGSAIRIFNMLGEKVLEQPLADDLISVPHLAAGLYFVKLDTKQASFTGKIILQ